MCLPPVPQQEGNGECQQNFGSHDKCLSMVAQIPVVAQLSSTLQSDLQAMENTNYITMPTPTADFSRHRGLQQDQNTFELRQTCPSTLILTCSDCRWET